MSEYKPFLEVIGEMQPGDIADCNHLDYNSIFLSKRGFEYMYSEGGVCPYPKVIVEPELLKLKYRIRPRYVNFKSALDALKDGKYVQIIDPEGEVVLTWYPSISLVYVFEESLITIETLLSDQYKFIIKETTHESC